ncbi:MAG: CPBP family intramembrane metalloprotease, partial [Planctomycetota bacterium]
IEYSMMLDEQGYQSEAEAVEARPVTVIPAERPPGPWGFWATIGFSLILLLALMGLGAIVCIVFVVVKMQQNPDAKFEQLVEGLTDNGFFLSLLTFIAYPCCLALVSLFARLRRGYPIKDYLVLQLTSKQILVKWLLGMTGFIIFHDVLTYTLGREIVPGFMTDVYLTAYFTPLLYLVVIVIAPVFEEVFIRGFMITGFRSSAIGATGAVLLSSLVWAGLHVQYDMYGISMIFVGGILLGIARLTTGSTYLTVILHAFMNIVATAEMLIKVHFIS